MNGPPHRLTVRQADNHVADARRPAFLGDAWALLRRRPNDLVP